MKTEVEKWVDDEGKERTRILHIVEFSNSPTRESIELKAIITNILLTLLIEGGVIGSVLVVYWLLKIY